MSDGRTERVRALLAREGVDARVTSAGIEGEIAAIRTRPEARETIGRLAPEVRALGFRYVALDMECDGPTNHGNQ